jgi:formylglycine-generating enzyme required for sulfatase activity/tRNA A-37 threonylcarbamoyl transferase component Bud32
MQIGDVLNRRYTLTARLGSGAMAEVFQATDSQTNEVVAAKVLDRKLTLDADIVERFKREGEALRQLRHRHIVSFVDTFQHEGQQVIVMECVSGGSLHQIIKRGPLPVEQARQVAIDLCDALTTAHRLNIVHRDVKPENVLVAQDGTPRLTDFGVARLVSEGTRLTGTGTQIGTPFYMSPEAWQGQRLDAQADIWSLGIVLYEMLTGDVPFGGDTLIAVMNKVLTAPLPDLKKLRPETPPALVKIVRRMLEREKAKRYQSLREVVLDLERVTATPAPMPTIPPAPQPPASRTQMAPKAKGDWPRWTLVAGGLALVLVVCVLTAGGGALVMKMMSQATPAPPATLAATAATRLVETPVPPAATPISMLPADTPKPPPPSGSSSTPPPTAPALGIGSTQMSPADGMMQVYVPAGDFLMGATDAEIAQDLQRCSTCSSGDFNDVKPQHTASLDAFWIDQTLVTNAMYAQCVHAGKCQTPSNTTSATRQSYYGNSQYDHYPVIYVSWDDANAYCQWAVRRLPTEAEWEKAARGTDGRLYPWGNQDPSPTLANSSMDVGDTTEVGKYPAGASPYGAMDMAGNVWEWVNDWYDANYYSTSPVRNPPGPATGNYRVLRGGSWGGAAYAVPAFARAYTAKRISASFGFRCAASPGK